ncbi:MarR family winged helix-turn-helix transcriptional regulator [Streptosporangium minutum]|uniref:MarR family transcriptional regulator n=1 Tax=Streptosporangium minutum TaxID=569862 RepID=A0A243RHX7_9ACTN|nr:MarR family winged helix-turn-helix transcriptional regulator [Streptosporangium minutum]OUC94453.1 MarR family transcriptional regulator [Streptosporangium minutum]
MNEKDRNLAPNEPADRLAEVFNLVGPLYRRAQRKVEQDAPVEGLSVGVRAVLNMLCEHGPMTVPQMGRAQALSRQFVQRMINDAAARNLVESVPNPAHKRSSLIRLTEEGRAAIIAVIDRERAVLRQAGGDLSDTEIDTCIRVLSRLLRFLDHVDVDQEPLTE